MFTGIIQSVGRIVSTETRGGDCRLLIEAGAVLANAKPGDSIAVSGICLTAAEIHDGQFAADVSRETLSLTTAGRWKAGSKVNLEPALAAGQPLGGHLVSGHVDGLGKLLDKHEDARSWRMRFEMPKPLSRYVAQKGSITLDGVSLTVNEAEGSAFAVNMVPHTLQHTTLGLLQPGDAINLEVDLIARYLEKLIAERK
ncbi:MAG: riboflavin synthase [Pseudomonadota bacterium]